MRHESGSKINIWCETNADQSPGATLEAEKVEPTAKKKKSTSCDGIKDEIDTIYKKPKEKHAILLFGCGPGSSKMAGGTTMIAPSHPTDYWRTKWSL